MFDNSNDPGGLRSHDLRIKSPVTMYPPGYILGGSGSGNEVQWNRTEFGDTLSNEPVSTTSPTTEESPKAVYCAGRWFRHA